MLSVEGLQLLKDLLCYDPKKRISCDEALKADYFLEDPRPIDPSMFPTWPAKSEQEPGDKGKFIFGNAEIFKYFLKNTTFTIVFKKKLFGLFKST